MLSYDLNLTLAEGNIIYLKVYFGLWAASGRSSQKSISQLNLIPSL